MVEKEVRFTVHRDCCYTCVHFVSVETAELGVVWLCSKEVPGAVWMEEEPVGPSFSVCTLYSPGMFKTVDVGQ